MVDLVINPLLEWVHAIIIGIIKFMFTLFNESVIELLNHSMFISLTNAFTGVAIAFSFLGIVIAVFDFFNTLNDSNEGFKNTSIVDYVLPMIYSILFSTFFVRGSLALFRFTNSFISKAFDIVGAIDIDFKPTFGGVDGVGAIINLIVIIILLIASYKLFKAFISLVPQLLILQIVSVNKAFSIARGDNKYVFELIKKVVGLNLILFIQVLFYLWGATLLFNPNFSISLKLGGLGLLIVSMNVERLLGEFSTGVSLSTGASGKAISGVKSAISFIK